MTQRIKAIIRYDGGAFAGWQFQPDQVTVQGAVEEALERICGHRVRVIGAGRTDAGVHALAQVCSFDWDGPKTPEELQRALSKMLGPAIRMESVETAAPDFHALRDAIGKTYAYSIYRADYADPFLEPYAWRVYPEVNPERLVARAQGVVGEYDFQGFQCRGTAVKSTVRTIHEISLHPGPVIGPCDVEEVWHLRFRGNGFLYKMIRNLMGTFVDEERGAIAEGSIAARLSAKGPFRGYTAPAHGLAMVRVFYPE